MNNTFEKENHWASDLLNDNDPDCLAIVAGRNFLIAVAAASLAIAPGCGGKSSDDGDPGGGSDTGGTSGQATSMATGAHSATASTGGAATGGRPATAGTGGTASTGGAVSTGGTAEVEDTLICGCGCNACGCT